VTSNVSQNQLSCWFIETDNGFSSKIISKKQAKEKELKKEIKGRNIKKRRKKKKEE